MTDRRYKILAISEELFVENLLNLLTGELPRRAFRTNLPPGCEYRGWDYRFTDNCFLVRLEHPSFEPVLPGEEIPRFELEVKECVPELDPVTGCAPDPDSVVARNINDVLTACQARWQIPGSIYDVRTVPQDRFTIPGPVPEIRRGLPDFVGAERDMRNAEAAIQMLRDMAKAQTPPLPSWKMPEPCPLPPTSPEIIKAFAASREGQLMMIRDGEIVAVVQRVRYRPDGKLEAEIWANEESFTFAIPDAVNPVTSEPDPDAPRIVGG
jgi:hypothetical protein